MKYNRQIEKAILEQIRKEPGRPIILPDWAYWKGDPQPWVYIDGMPTRLIRHLYDLVVGNIHPDHGLVNPPEIDPRNVNPHLAKLTPTRKSKLVCPKGHRYTGDDYVDGVGNQCQTCRADKLLGTPSVADKNRAKKKCPAGHRYTKKNTIRLKSGRRRCRICHAEQNAALRERKKGTSP